uniref:Uncharacterized protein n=1 Tax=Thermogemmatispora argillosa TaxID=2045280 RepID=A0A455T096_9CHLR|nr:hypothetical protein KTA_15490 [Thermogemmatispora argillosa]
MISSATFPANVGYVYTYSWQNSTLIPSATALLLAVVATAPNGTSCILTAYPVL